MMKDYRFPNEFQKLGQAQARTMMIISFLLLIPLIGCDTTTMSHESLDNVTLADVSI